MTFGTAMAVANVAITGLDMAFGTTKKHAQAIADAQRSVLKAQKEYNTEQINEMYKKGYSQMMTNLVDSRYEQVNGLDKAKDDLDVFMSQNGANVADSSYEQDMDNQLDVEFTNNVQNLYTNWVNQASSLMANKTSQELQLTNNYLTQNNQIDTTLNRVDEQMMNKLVSSAGLAASSVVSDYGGFKKKQGEGASLSKYFTTFGQGGK